MLTKAIAKGEVVYSEEAMVSCLFENDGTHCACCLKECTDSTGYCSIECKEKDSSIFGANYLYPPEDRYQAARHASDFISLCKDRGVISPILSAKFLARMVFDESAKEMGNLKHYSQWDHMERLHYIDLGKPSLVGSDSIWFAKPEDLDKEAEMMFRLFGSVPRFDKCNSSPNQVLSKERYNMLRGKFLYNAFGIPGDYEKKSNVEYFKKDGNYSVIGAGLFHITSYLSHACNPNVSLSFEGNILSLVAEKDLSVGEELLVSYIPVELSLKERRSLLKEKYRFHCKCDRCEKKE